MKNCYKKALCLLLLFAQLFLLCSCLEHQTEESDDEYLTRANWHCSAQEFKETYFVLYSEKIETLKQQYQINCQTQYEWAGAHKVTMYLYDSTFTILITLINLDDGIGVSYASCDMDLYVYGEEAQLSDYSAQEIYIQFLNDFINYAAFDTKTEENRFETLYNESIAQGRTLVFDYYREFNSVGYTVHRQNTYGRYFYEMSMTGETDILCNRYRFEGILKPLF